MSKNSETILSASLRGMTTITARIVAGLRHLIDDCREKVGWMTGHLAVGPPKGTRQRRKRQEQEIVAGESLPKSSQMRLRL
jgi:hypothetical protein